jgi:hypothetical protein
MECPQCDDERAAGCLPHQLKDNAVYRHFASTNPLPTEGRRLKVPRLKEKRDG